MSDLINIKNQIESLNNVRQKEVLKILIKNKVSMSENKNGTFINLTLLDENVLSELNKFLLYIEDQEESIKELEVVKSEFKTNFFMKDNKEIKDSNNSDGIESVSTL